MQPKNGNPIRECGPARRHVRRIVVVIVRRDDAPRAVSAPTTKIAPGKQAAFSTNFGVLVNQTDACQLNGDQAAPQFVSREARLIDVVDAQLECDGGADDCRRGLSQTPVPRMNRIERPQATTRGVADNDRTRRRASGRPQPRAEFRRFAESIREGFQEFARSDMGWRSINRSRRVRFAARGAARRERIPNREFVEKTRPQHHARQSRQDAQARDGLPATDEKEQIAQTTVGSAQNGMPCPVRPKAITPSPCASRTGADAGAGWRDPIPTPWSRGPRDV